MLHTAVYWRMLTVRDAIPRLQPVATAEFATLRLRLLKVAVRVIETATRVRIAFFTAYPEADLFHGIARSLQPAGPWWTGHLSRPRSLAVIPTPSTADPIATKQAPCTTTSAAQRRIRPEHAE